MSGTLPPPFEPPGPLGNDIMLQQQQQQQHQQQEELQQAQLFSQAISVPAMYTSRNLTSSLPMAISNTGTNVIHAPAAAPAGIMANLNIMDGNGETMLAREMAKLSVNEREKVMLDIHGVNDETVRETPELVASRLADLDTQLAKLTTQTDLQLNDLPTTAASAYNLAMSLNPCYVQDTKFRLLFLRACNFQVEPAARCMVAHFEKKLELFEPSKLCQKITQQDLTVDDMNCLRNGQSQLLPYRDVSGRAVFFQALSHYQYRSVENAIRAVYYILMSALEDEETQKRGIVCVVYNVEPRSEVANDPRIYLNVYKLLPSLPVKVMGVHYCVQDAHLRLFMSSIRVAMSREVRLRSRVHHGSHQECISALLTFGVPRRCFPIVPTSGELMIEKHGEFIEMRRRQEGDSVRAAVMSAEETRSNAPPTSHLTEAIVVPTNVDVLLGRGRPFQEHSGNLRYNYVVLANIEKYENAARNGKTAIARLVIEQIHGYGGRFLKQNDSVWGTIDNAEALRKISHSFRTHRQMLKEQNEETFRTADGSGREKRPRPK